MATNFFFNNYQNSMEQRLLEELVMESIRIYGQDIYYIPMVTVAKDQLYGEVAHARYDNAYPIEMYIKNVDGFGGDGTFLSKFNIEIRDEIEFSISSRVFAEEVGVAEDLSRPREADLLWFPMVGRMFKISYVNERPVFHQLGTIAFVDLKCQMFEYSNEVFNTGIAEIDALTVDYSISIDDLGILLESGDTLVDEDGYTVMQEASGTPTGTRIVTDSDIIQQEADDFLDFTEIDPFSEGTY